MYNKPGNIKLGENVYIKTLTSKAHYGLFLAQKPGGGALT